MVRAFTGALRRRVPAVVGVIAWLLCGSGPAWAQQSGDLRLSDGSSTLDGRLEILFSGTWDDEELSLEWGRICWLDFGEEEAAVACRQLGSYAVPRDIKAYLATPPSIPIWLSDIDCEGTETRLDSCTHVTPGTCRHLLNVSLDCRPRISLLDVVHGRVYEGEDIVMVLSRTLRAGEESSARQLVVAVTVTETGSVLSGTAPTQVTFAAGSSTATLTVATDDDEVVERDGYVRVAISPPAGALYRRATLATDAVVVDDNDTPVVSLAADTTTRVIEGHSAVFSLTRSGATDAQLSGTRDESREVGAMLSGPPPSAVTFAAGSGSATLSVATVDDAAAEHDSIIIAKVAGGEGYERGRPSGDSMTVLDDDSALPAEGDIELRDGYNEMDGRAHVYLNGRWGTICPAGFDPWDATVVCRQLGFSSEARQRINWANRWLPSRSAVLAG